MKNSRPNILMISARADLGGGPEHLYQLTKRLKSDFNIFIACPNDKPYRERYAEEIGKNNLFIIPHRKFSIIKLIQLYLFIKKNNISIVHSHGKGAGIYSRPLSMLSPKLKCVHTFHGLHIGSYGNLAKLLYLKLESFLGFFTDKFITVSLSEKRKIIQNEFVNVKKIVLIENGVELNESPVLHSNGDSKNIIHVTRFDYQKNTELLIDIALQLKDESFFQGYKFLIVGDGENRESFEEKVSEQNLSEMFVLTGATNDVSKYYKESFCIISTSRWEGLPLALLESMSYGLPVIATAVTGNSELVIDGFNGYLFSADELDEIKDYFKYLILDENKRKFFSENSLNLVKEKYNVETMAEKTAELYLETLGRETGK